MAMFGFVYLWYLMVVLVLEIWFDYRRELVLKARASRGLVRVFYRVLTLGSDAPRNARYARNFAAPHSG